ncbi:MAG: hypothetical protein RLZZ176_1877 [Cyanobacteriota bacterium]
MTIYFYKVCQPYGCFSNFSPHGIEMEGIYWPTVEHYYHLGRCPSRRLRPDWELVKTQVMRVGVLQKFITHPDIREILLITGDEMLIENSPTDYFWGCGANHTGENHLGKILMGVRAEIRLQLLEI